MPKKCDVCDESPARYNNIFDMILCKKCREEPEYKLIYKTTAKNKYYLTDKDINLLECFKTIGSNGYSKHSEVTLIREIDVINYFCEKHNISEDKLDKTLEKLEKIKQKKSDKIKLTKEQKRKERKKDLISALKKVGLEFRTDSKLCNGFIDGTIKDWDIKKIVKRMCQMKFLYDYANMDYYFIKAKKNQSEELNAGYFPDMSVFEQAEMYALNKIGGYPKKWPWLVKI